MAELAKQIKVTRSHGRMVGYSLTIDGEEFPWLLTEEGVTTSVSREGVPSVTLTILADQVEVDHRLGR